MTTGLYDLDGTMGLAELEQRLMISRNERVAIINAPAKSGLRLVAAGQPAPDQADVVVAATGQTHMVKPEWIKPGAVVLDVGVSRVWDEAANRYRVAGDVDPEVAEVADWVSPNPGGVGPMTRAMLLANVVATARRQANL